MEKMYIVEIMDPPNPLDVKYELCNSVEVEKFFIKERWKESYKNNMRKYFERCIREEGHFTIHDYPTIVIIPLEECIRKYLTTIELNVHM